MLTSKVTKLSLLRGYLFSNVAKVMFIILNAQSYVLVKLCKVAGSIHLFKLVGKLTLECDIEKKLDLGYIRDRLERSQCDFQWE